MRGDAATPAVHVTPRQDESSVKNGSNSRRRGLDLLQILQQILHSTAVTTILGMTPAHDGCIRQEWRQKHRLRLGSAAHSSADPGQHHCHHHHPRSRSICTRSKNGSKSALSSLHLMHVHQLILHSTTVTTIVSITPGREGSITKDGSKSSYSGLDLLHTL